MSSAEETLKKQLPRYFRPIMEFGEILKAQGYSLDQFDGDSARVYANNYIATCDEDTITYYERLLGIAYRFGDTLEYRRTRVLQKYNMIFYGMLCQHISRFWPISRPRTGFHAVCTLQEQ